MRRFLVLTILDLALLVVKCLYMGQGGLYILPSTEVTHLFVQGVVLLYQTMHIDITMLFVACQIVNIKSNLILFFCFSQFVCSFLLYFFVVLLSLNEAFYIFFCSEDAVNIDNVRISFCNFGNSLKKGGDVNGFVISAFCRSLFHKNHPSKSKKNYFFPSIGVSYPFLFPPHFFLYPPVCFPIYIEIEFFFIFIVPSIYF